MMKKTIVLKKTASLVLALLMIVSTLVVLPFGASAETPKGWTDSDTENNIYYIATSADMKSFQSTSAAQAAGAKVYLTADIDMSGVNDWAPLATFYGTFDGQGHTISNLKVTNALATLFITASGTIQNITLDKCNLTPTSNGLNIALLVGASISGSDLLMDNVHIMNSTLAKNGTTWRLGGFVGRVNGSLTIRNSSLIDSTIESGKHSYGSFAGYINASATSVVTIENCYSNATVSGGGYAGGFCGMMQNGTFNITNCVYTGTLSGTMNANNSGYFGHVNDETMNGNVTVTDCAYFGTNSGFQMFSGTEWSATRCITAADLDTQKDTLLANGWVTTADKVTVGEEQVTVIVPTAVCTYFTCPIPTTDVYYQKKENGNGTVDIRFVAVINDLSYANVGFNIQATRGEGDGAQTSQKITKTTTTVYTSVTALGDNVTAESLGGQYIYVIEIKNVDVNNYAHSFDVSAFVTVQNGEDQIVWEAATQTATVEKAS